MTILTVVPVRGGSKGIPRKNLRLVGGRPLLAWTLDQALAADADLHVVVSTDDAELADVARRAGADVPWLRPADLAQDTTPTEPVVRHALAWFREVHGEPEAILLLQATSPVRLPGTIDRAVAELRASDVDSLVGVVPVAPFLWYAGGTPGAGPRAAYDVDHRPRRQDFTRDTLPHRETGSLYLTRPWVYDERDNRLGGKIGLFVMDEVEGLDIDTVHDLDLADLTLTRLAAHTRTPEDETP